MNVDTLFFIWIKLVILSGAWVFGYVAYAISNDIPYQMPYILYAYGPACFIVVVPFVLLALHFLFFVWE